MRPAPLPFFKVRPKALLRSRSIAMIELRRRKGFSSRCTNSRLYGQVPTNAERDGWISDLSPQSRMAAGYTVRELNCAFPPRSAPCRPPLTVPLLRRPMNQR